MNKQKRYLITNADERTWKFDRPVVFLGEWCRLYDRKHVWESMDAIVADPFGVQSDRKEYDINYVHTLSNKLLAEIVDVLNAFHETNHSSGFWNVLLGHWLQRYVAVCFNRYHTIELALKNYKLTGVTALNMAGYNLATQDSSSFIWASNDDIWNGVLYAKIFQRISRGKVEVSLTFDDKEACFNQKQFGKGKLRSIVTRLINFVGSNVLPLLSKPNDAFIINSYLPKWEEIKLQIALWQFPQLWQSRQLTLVPVDMNKRLKLTLPKDGQAGFEQFVRDLLPELIPICYVEGYDQLNQQVALLPWPSNPRFIFTSNNFDTDEVFKLWVAQKIEKRTPYFVGQHGNNYGTLLGYQNWVELVSADKFFTWGWRHGDSKNIPAFIFKMVGSKRNIDSDGGLLLTELHSPHGIALNDAYHDFCIYQEQQFNFVEALPDNIKKELTVRLHGAWPLMRWSDDKRWSDRAPDVLLEKGLRPIRTLIKTSRLVIHSYDSTGILETLALNIPTMCFWSGGFDHLVPSAKPYYALLRDVGIFFDTPEKAAEAVVRYWDDIDSWWLSESVQNVRQKFCEEYARIERRPVRTLRNLLIKSMFEVNRKFL